MATVAISLHHHRPDAVKLANDAVAWLREHGHDACFSGDDGDVDGIDGAIALDERNAGSVALAISLGGDGTMLRTVCHFAAYDVPVLGVNVGQLGYLTAVEPGGLALALSAFFAGDYRIEERMTLEVEVERGADASPPGRSAPSAGLNEAVVEKTVPGHTVRLGVSISGEFFTTYVADGLIVSTPTGSTAYNLSARGPIVAPEHRALVLTAVSPHMLFDRSLVLDPSEEVRLEVLDGLPGAVSVDGRDLGTLAPGDALVCRGGEHVARLVVFQPRDFLRVLKTKFGLADR